MYVSSWGLCSIKDLSSNDVHKMGQSHFCLGSFMILGQNSTYHKMDVIGMFHSRYAIKLCQMFELSAVLDILE